MSSHWLRYRALYSLLLQTVIKQLYFLYLEDILIGNKILGQLASATMLFAKFHADTRKSLSDFLPPPLEQPIKFVLVLSGLRQPWIITNDQYLTNVFHETKKDIRFIIWRITEAKTIKSSRMNRHFYFFKLLETLIKHCFVYNLSDQTKRWDTIAIQIICIIQELS